MRNIQLLLDEWSNSLYTTYLANRLRWDEIGLPTPDGPRFLFEDPAGLSELREFQEKFSVSLPREIVDFYLLSNGWTFSIARGASGAFLPISAVNRIENVDPAASKTLGDTLSLLGKKSSGFFLLTDNPMGSEMVIASCDFSFFLVDPFLGDLEPRSSFESVLLEYRHIFFAGLKELLRNH
ncbi:MAG: hypothetical protein U1F26_14555 [Lysobacterales bacterium]